MKILYALLTLLPLIANAEVTSQVSLDQYLGEVKKSNDGYQGIAASQEGFQSAAQEGELPFYTQLFSSFQHIDDKRQTIVPVFEGTRTLTNSYLVGVKRLFDFGLQSQISYGITSNTLYGVSPALVPQNSLYTNAFTLQLTQSLWQNGFGAQDKANRQAIEAQDLANSFSNAYQNKTTLSDAESRYWALAIARELVTVQKASADRTIVVRDFNAKRARSHLIDESDLLTSEAQAKSKQFDLKTAIDNERVAARAFNSARGVDSDQVDEKLVLPEPHSLESIALPERVEMRDDVKSAEQTEKAVSASSEAAIQKQKPSLNLTGTLSTNGLDPTLNTATSNTLTTQYPYFAVGVNFSVPLDFGTISSVKKAYAEEMKGAELTYHRKLFDQENDWQDLVKKVREAKERLAIAIEVEDAQKVKFQHESLRQRQGVTTTYQVFQYEIDYLTSVLNRIQTEATILTLISQMKTYGADS